MLLQPCTIEVQSTFELCSLIVDADAALVVYDITNRSSYEALQRWLGELKMYAPPDLSKHSE
jgi:GTPase SAR1 family protein